MDNSRNPAQGWTFCGFGQTCMHPTELSLCLTSPMLCLFLAPPNPRQPQTLSLSPEHCPVRCPRGGMCAVKPSRLASCARRPAPAAAVHRPVAIAPRGRAVSLPPQLGNYEYRESAFSQKDTKTSSQNSHCCSKSGTLVVTKTSLNVLPARC